MTFSLLRLSCRIVSRTANRYSTYNVQGWNKTIFKRFSCPNQFDLKKLNVASSSMSIFRSNIETNLRLYSSKNKKSDHKHKEESDSDSDEEEHVLKPKGESPFWRRKMRTFHNILDLNKDGVISYDDFKIMADRFVDLGHLSPQCQNEFYQTIQLLWETQWGPINEYNLVTVERYLNDMYHVVNDKELRDKVHLFLPYLFKAVDNDKNGEISVDEFKLFFKCLDLSEDAATTTFSIIDNNKDGKLSLDEFVALGREFYLSEDHKSISQMFWGPLSIH